MVHNLLMFGFLAGSLFRLLYLINVCTVSLSLSLSLSLSRFRSPLSISLSLPLFLFYLPLAHLLIVLFVHLC